MGNVMAHSAPQPPMSDPLTPPVAPKTEDQEGFVKENGGIPHPGTMEELHKQCTEVFPMVFEGGKFVMNKALSNHFQVNHTVNFSTLQPPGYRFGATYVGNIISPTEVYPVISGDMDPSGNLNASMMHQITSNIKGKFVAQIDGGRWQATQTSAEYRGDTSSASITLGNIDIFNGAGLAVAHYLQQVSPNIALGTELAYQYGPQLPGGHVALHSVAAKYTGKDFVASGTLGTSGIHLCYYQKCSEHLQIGTDLETSLRMGESVASTAFQVDIPKGNCVVKGKIDSNLTVGVTMEKRLAPLPFTFQLSAMHSHTKNKFKLGAGIVIG